LLNFLLSIALQHKGEGVAVLARATGELWSALDPTQRKPYEVKAAEEREKLSRDMQRLKDAGLWPETISGVGTEGEAGDEDLILPVARIRKICKLDPDVKGMSKESTMLIAKATELFCVKLGNECVTMAQMQNRRKLLPEDVVEVCSMKERFMFLKDDLKDLAKEQIKERREKEREEGKPGGATSKPVDGKASVSLLSYFSKA
jgi:histone H3/H4